MIKFSKLLILIGFLIVFHAGYAVSKYKSHILDIHNHFNLMKFPVEILIEIILSFILVSYGSLLEYSNFEEINVEKQCPEKKMKFIQKPMLSNNTKGRLLNYYSQTYIGPAVNCSYLNN